MNCSWSDNVANCCYGRKHHIAKTLLICPVRLAYAAKEREQGSAEAKTKGYARKKPKGADGASRLHSEGFS